jgi:hypothetical protein
MTAPALDHSRVKLTDRDSQAADDPVTGFLAWGA